MIDRLRSLLGSYNKFPEREQDILWETHALAALLSTTIHILERLQNMGQDLAALQADLDAIKAGLAAVPDRITAVVAAAVAAQKAADDAGVAAAVAEADGIAQTVAGLAAQPSSSST